VEDAAPVLLLGYNRPQQLAGLIKSLEPYKPKLILIAVDGPRALKPNDAELVRQTQETLSLISWNAEVLTRFRESNVGLRNAVVDAVTWATTTYGNAIVIEDDVRVGPELLEYMNHNLYKFRNESKIAHINGYNLVPVEHISNPNEQSRLSIYPESYAWATWDKAWQKYDDDLTWAKNSSLMELKSIVGSTLGAIRWKQNFADAASERIDTWAYRWLASMWSHKLLMVSPNQNLVTYTGQVQGTHTRRKTPWNELPIQPLTTDSTSTSPTITKPDPEADKWLAKNIFKESPFGLAAGLTASIALEIIKRLRPA